MLTDTQRTCMDVIEIFEAGRPDKYDILVSIKGDTGGLSGGLLQASMMSGNLGKLLRLYRNMGGQMISEEEVCQTEAKDLSQNSDPIIRQMFKAAATDPIMAAAQDAFFYGQFMQPAEQWCAAHSFVLPLTITLVLDGVVHGHFYGEHGFGTIVPRLPEKNWAMTYVGMRKKWLLEHPNPVLHKCVYRMEFFEQMMKISNWQMTRPLVAHGFELK